MATNNSTRPHQPSPCQLACERIDAELQMAESAHGDIPHLTIGADPRTAERMCLAATLAAQFRQLLELVRDAEARHYLRLVDDNGNLRPRPALRLIHQPNSASYAARVGHGAIVKCRRNPPC